MALLIIEPARAEKNYWRDIWSFRELFYVLAWRDVTVRYKQTLIGLAWAVVRPVLAVAVFTVIFGRVAKLPAPDETPYALMVFAGMLPWQFFSSALGDSANSLINNVNLVGKIYFPRLIVPTATVVVGMVDFMVGLVLLAGMMIWFQIVPGWQILLLPVFIAAGFLAALGPGMLFAAVNVKYRDFRYVVPFCIQLGLYVSPVGFSSAVLPEHWRILYSLNPMVGVIDGFRWCLFGGVAPLFMPGMTMGGVVIAVFLWFGLRTFRKTEKSFADYI
jgi:lipopolysaccharide transport system permease protein